jgi:hypothetical protein
VKGEHDGAVSELGDQNELTVQSGFPEDRIVAAAVERNTNLIIVNLYCSAGLDEAVVKLLRYSLLVTSEP